MSDVLAESRTNRYPDDEVIGLTDLQVAYLMGSKSGMDLGGIDPTFGLEFSLPQSHSVSELDESLRRVTRYCDALGLRIHDETCQKMAAHQEVILTHHDARELSHLSRNDLLSRLRHQLSTRPDAAISVTVVSVDDKYRVFVSTDLSVIDPTSTLDIIDHWAAALDSPTYQPDWVPVHTSQGWASTRQLGDDAKKAQAQWSAQLDTFDRVAPELPLAQTPDTADDVQHGHHHLTIPPSDWAALVDVAHQRGLNPVDIPLIAFNEIIRRWSKEPDYCLNVVERPHDQPYSGDASAAGQLAVPGLVPNQSALDSTFGERATQLAEAVNTTRDRSAWSAIRVLRELRRQDTHVTAPIVYTNLIPEGQHGDRRLLGDLVYITSRAPQVWCETQVFLHNGALVIAWHWVKDLFPSSTITTMADALQDLLHEIATEPAIWDSTSPVAVPPHQAREQHDANSTDQPIPLVTLHALADQGAQQHPGRPAIIASDGITTHAELSDQAGRVATVLRQRQGDNQSPLVAVMLPAGASQIAAILGVLRSGSAYVVIDPGLPQSRRRALLERCAVRHVVTTDVVARDVVPDGVNIVSLPSCEDAAPTSADAHGDPGDLAYVIFTSGSTGEPKGVMVTHKSAANTVQDITQRFDIGCDDRVLSLAPANFDLSVFDLFGLLSVGGALVIPEAQQAQNPDHWVDLTTQNDVTVWNTVPAPMRLFVDAVKARSLDVSGLRVVLLSGDWIPLDLPDRITQHCSQAKVISLGGATEGSIWSIVYPVTKVDPQWTSIPYGTALANQTMHVVNRSGEPCPTWVVGEIQIGGVGLAQGYFKAPELTEQRFIVDPRTGDRRYRTGDLGRFLPGGCIEILGREDNQVKINGYRVELAEIETCLATSDQISQVVVSAPKHSQTGQRHIIAHAVSSLPGETFNENQLREHVAAHLPNYMVPARIVSIPEIPLTRNGKVDRSALPEPRTTTSSVEPENSPHVCESIKKVWSEHLGHNDFSSDDGFFDVGGDSLHAVGIVRDMCTLFSIDEQREQDVIETLFMNGSPAALAALVEAPA